MIHDEPRPWCLNCWRKSEVEANPDVDLSDTAIPLDESERRNAA